MPCCSITARCATALLLLCPLVTTGQDQQGSGTPYSAHGLGDLMGSTQVSQAIMGGVGVALAEPFSVVHLNPASYAFLSGPAFEAGMVARSIRYDTGTEGYNGRRADLLGFTMGVPFGHGRWGLALGLNPVSKVGYDITDTGPMPEGTGEMTYRYSGDGGLSRAFLGLAHVLVRRTDSLGNGGRLSMGANVNYLFGSVEETRRAIYPRNQGYYNTSVVGSLVLRDPAASVGMQYQGDMVKRATRDDDGLRYVVGVAAELPAGIGARRTEVVSSYILGGSGVEFPVDTTFIIDGSQGRLRLPLQLSMGVTVYDARWTVTAEHRRRDWDQLGVDVEGYEMRSELGAQAFYALGASLRPAGNGRGSFWSNTIYRAGVRYVDDYLVVRGNQLRETAVALGLSVPVMSSTTRSRLTLGAELNEQGTTADGLIRQRSVSVFVGFTITPDIREQWFRKRRIE